MLYICEMVQQVLTRGYLTVANENQLRQLLSTKYDSEDLKGFMSLQLAAMSGKVRQESREFISQKSKPLPFGERGAFLMPEVVPAADSVKSQK